MVPCGLEPRTLRLLAVRSNQLSYEAGGRVVSLAITRKAAASCAKGLRGGVVAARGRRGERGPDPPEVAFQWLSSSFPVVLTPFRVTPISHK